MPVATENIKFLLSTITELSVDEAGGQIINFLMKSEQRDCSALKLGF